jgi:hypothetical protein
MLIAQSYWPVEFVLECTGLLVITACRGIVQESWMFVVWTNMCWIWHKVNCCLLPLPLFSLMGIFKFQFDGITKPTVLLLMTEWRLEVLNAIRAVDPSYVDRPTLCGRSCNNIAALPGLWLCSNFVLRMSSSCHVALICRSSYVHAWSIALDRRVALLLATNWSFGFQVFGPNFVRVCTMDLTTFVYVAQGPCLPVWGGEHLTLRLWKQVTRQKPIQAPGTVFQYYPQLEMPCT